MSVLQQKDAKKWINALVVVISVLLGYVCHSFLLQLSEWFDLEARIPKFLVVSQFVSFLLGLALFLIVSNHKDASGYLNEVYSELLKVVWPDRQSTLKLTFGILIGLIFSSMLLGLVDYGIGRLFRLIY